MDSEEEERMKRKCLVLVLVLLLGLDLTLDLMAVPFAAGPDLVDVQVVLMRASAGTKMMTGRARACGRARRP